MDVYVRFDFPGLTSPSGEPISDPSRAQEVWLHAFLDACDGDKGLPSDIAYRVVLRRWLSMTLRFTLPGVSEPRAARKRISTFLRTNIDHGLPGSFTFNSFTFLEPVAALLLLDDRADACFLRELERDLNDASFAALIPTPTPGA